MAQQRSTFAKLQRERDKKDKAAAKAERRQRGSEPSEAPEPVQPLDPAEETAILAELAELHAAFEDGTVSIDDFETRRDRLRARLQMGGTVGRRPVGASLIPGLSGERGEWRQRAR